MNEPADRPVVNFGGNVTFQPAVREIPRSEAELLDALRRHRGRRLRVIGRLHAWSEAAVCPEVLIDLRHLNSVAIHEESDAPWAEIGAGCQIRQVIASLQAQGWTTPTLGLITVQSLAGAASTGTHGSGKHSLSHYPQSLRIAIYDPETGEPVLRTVDSGDELRAARCGLGLLGIVVSVRLPIRRQYMIEEHFRRYATLEQVLDQEADSPQQQFFLVPWRWDFFAQHRREIDKPRSRLAPLYRVYWMMGMDRIFHWMLMALARCLPAFCTKLFFRWLLPVLVPQGWKVVDRSDRQLTMEHELYRHIEIESFVTQRRLKSALSWCIWLLRHASGESVEPEPEFRKALEDAGEWDRLQGLKGRYLHHYPICVRKILADDTLISMAAGDETAYSVSFVSYARPDKRAGFFEFATVLARTTAILFEARPHWGKFCPIDSTLAQRVYPQLARFQKIRSTFDPDNIFGNAWLDEVLPRVDQVGIQTPT
jgi:FAD/FMN-containing dehydrogenase